jgi:hypothetical protein
MYQVTKRARIDENRIDIDTDMKRSPVNIDSRGCPHRKD